MPFTPFHFGPGAAIKAAFPRHFSFTVFCFAQVVTDLEVPIYMLRNDGPLHRHLHTYPGAVAVGLVSLFVGRPMCRAVLRWWRTTPGLPLKEYYNSDPEISFCAALTGGFLGSFSHIVLDSIMHADVAPFAPFSLVNSIYGLLGAGAVHAFCFASGLFGAWWCARRRS